MIHLILTGGIGAGKTNLTQRLEELGFISGSPADVLKHSLSEYISREWVAGKSSYNSSSAYQYYLDMNNQQTKPKYRELLQAFGEFFSNQDPFHWINRVMEQIKVDIQDWPHKYDTPLFGTVYDSIRRPQEIQGIVNVFPDAKIVYLRVKPERQIEYLAGLGMDDKKIVATLNHPSEMWLGKTVDERAAKADIVIDANYGDEYIWYELLAELAKEEPTSDFVQAVWQNIRSRNQWKEILDV